jgi:HAD superfamily hydrolase (TIGR01662 family)
MILPVSSEAVPLVHPLPYTLFLFDVDQTLRHTVVDGIVQRRPPNYDGEWQLLPRVVETLARYQWGVAHFFGLVSNQGGVGLGYSDRHTVTSMLWATADAAFFPTGRPTVGDLRLPDGIVRACFHAPHAGCYCRKPSPYLLLDAVADHARFRLLRLDQVVMIGDDATDCEAAVRAGMAFCWARDFFGWADTFPRRLSVTSSAP